MSRLRSKFVGGVVVGAAVAVGLASSGVATPAGVVDYTTTAPITVQQFGRDLQSPDSTQDILFGAKLVAAQPVHFDELIFAVRGPGGTTGTNYDIGDRDGYDLGTAQQTFTATRPALPVGNGYTVWVAYRQGSTWTDLAPNPAQTFNVVAPPTTPPPPSGDPKPFGAANTGTWNLRFQEEFSGSSVDTSKWSFRSSAEALWCDSPFGTGNPGNKQLEFLQPANASVANGQLTITSRRQNVTACGRTYNWTSSLLTSSPSFAFQYGYMETRADMPDLRGFWPAFWTWQAAGNNQWTETDVFEYYSDNHNALYLSQHSGAGGGCRIDPAFDPSVGMHVYGADIAPDGTRFYVDGVQVCFAPGTSTGLTNVLLDTFVFADVPPASTTTVERTFFDYVRVWQR